MKAKLQKVLTDSYAHYAGKAVDYEEDEKEVQMQRCFVICEEIEAFQEQVEEF